MGGAQNDEVVVVVPEVVLTDIVHFFGRDLREEVVVVIVERAEPIVEDYQNLEN